MTFRGAIPAVSEVIMVAAFFEVITTAAFFEVMATAASFEVIAAAAFFRETAVFFLGMAAFEGISLKSLSRSNSSISIRKFECNN